MSQNLKDIHFIRCLFDKAAAASLWLIIMGFYLSFVYNFSYFDKLDRVNFLTLLDFNDYIQSSLVFIALMIIALFYSRIIYVDPDGIVGKLKCARVNQKAMFSDAKLAFSGSILFKRFLFSSFNIFITVLQIIAGYTPYFVVMFFLISAYLNSVNSIYASENRFLVDAISVSLLLFFIDILIGLRPKKYFVRKIIFKVIMIITSLAYAFGNYNASRLYIENKEAGFVRSVNKGIFEFYPKSGDLIFLPWSEVKKIQS